MNSEYIHCPGCLREIISGRPYCEYCGTPLDLAEDAQSETNKNKSNSFNNLNCISNSNNSDTIQPDDSSESIEYSHNIKNTDEFGSVNSDFLLSGGLSKNINSEERKNDFAIDNNNDGKDNKPNTIIIILLIVIALLITVVGVLIVKNNRLSTVLNNHATSENMASNNQPNSNTNNNPQSNSNQTNSNQSNNNTNNNQYNYGSNQSANNTNGGFQIRINSEIRIRPSASTSGKIIGHVYADEIYYVYEVKETKEYTWYRIGENMWIADGGGWITRLDSENTTTQNNDILFRIVITKSGNNVRIRSSATTKNENNVIGNVKTNEEYDVYETTVGEGYNWYRIGTNKWIADGGGWIQIMYDYSYHNSNKFPNDVAVYQDSNGNLIVESSNSDFLDDLLGQWDEGGTEARQILLHFSKKNSNYGVNDNLANIIRNGDGSYDMHRNGNTVVVNHHELGNSTVFVWNDYYDVYIKTLKFGDKTFENIFLSD